MFTRRSLAQWLKCLGGCVKTQVQILRWYFKKKKIPLSYSIFNFSLSCQKHNTTTESAVPPFQSAVPPSQSVAPFCRPLLEAFSVPKLSVRQIFGNLVDSNFYNIFNFLIWCSFVLSKIQSPNTSQNAQNEAAKMQWVVFIFFFLVNSQYFHLIKRRVMAVSELILPYAA